MASIMLYLDKTATGQFCWVDLAPTDAARATAFYRQVFGWTPREQAANGGTFTRLQLSERDVGSIYQLRRKRIDDGMPSHWTPYVRVDDADDAARRTVACGGEVIVRPFAVAGMARIALIMDSVGAIVGLWEPIAAGAGEVAHG